MENPTTTSTDTGGGGAPVIYILSTGEKIRANSASELIQFLREGTFDNADESDAQYMFRFSERVLLTLQRVVRIDTPENFIKDLQTVGMIAHAIVAN